MSERNIEPSHQPRAQEATKLDALLHAVRVGWNDVAAGRYTDVEDAQLEDFIDQLGLQASRRKWDD